MRIAFYAPLKAPDHPIASGDRRVAQLLFEALRRAGHQPFLASRLRSYDGVGNAERQARLAALGHRTADRLLRRWRERPETAPELWFTYHLYYKAPDWLGPRLSAALGIPYLIAEASSAAKRAAGAWAFGHCAVVKAIGRADRIIGLNAADRDGVLPLLADPDRWVFLPPFLDSAEYRAAKRNGSGPPRLIAVAMMRHGAKLASFRVLAASLAQLQGLAWSLEIVGDGPARAEVERCFAPFGACIAYAGAVDRAAVAARLAAADICVWPAIDEAFGMALLEAQASGLPVVAGAGGGVAGIVRQAVTGLLVPPGDATEFAGGLRALLLDPERRAAMGRAARRKVVEEHDIAAAADRLNRAVAAR